MYIYIYMYLYIFCISEEGGGKGVYIHVFRPKNCPKWKVKFSYYNY